jgi:hypothetical protein
MNNRRAQRVTSYPFRIHTKKKHTLTHEYRRQEQAPSHAFEYGRNPESYTSKLKLLRFFMRSDGQHFHLIGTRFKHQPHYQLLLSTYPPVNLRIEGTS